MRSYSKNSRGTVTYNLKKYFQHFKLTLLNVQNEMTSQPVCGRHQDSNKVCPS